MVEVDGVRHAGLAVGLTTVNPVAVLDEAGGSLYKKARALEIPRVRAFDELPFGAPVLRGWYVSQSEADGPVSIDAPDGATLAHDLTMTYPEGWHESAAATESVILVVCHVLPAVDDMVTQLAYELEHDRVCAAPVRFAASPGEPAPPFLRIVIDPVGQIWELTVFVAEGIMSRAEARRWARIMGESHSPGEDDVTATQIIDTLVAGGANDDDGMANQQSVYWLLVTEVAEGSGGPHTCPGWRTAATRALAQSVQVVAESYTEEAFRDADALATRLIAHLREVGDREGLADALVDAARLRMAVRGPLDLTGDTQIAGVPTTWFATLTAELYRTQHTDEEPFQLKAPRLLGEAADFLSEAVEVAEKPTRALALLAQLSADENGVHQDLARAALSSATDATDPDVLLFLARTVVDVGPGFAQEVRARIFGTAPGDFVAEHGTATTNAVVSHGIALALEWRDRDFLRGVLEWADALSHPLDDAHHRQLIEARLHVLPDDPIECPAPEEDLPAGVPDSWPPAQRSAALLHLAAHARARRQPALGLSLLRQTSPPRGAPAILLNADLHFQAVEVDEPVPSPLVFPWGYYSTTALRYKSLGMDAHARASLVPFVQRLGGLAGEELREAVCVIILDLPNFDSTGVPALAEVLHDLVHHAMWQLVVHSDDMSPSLLIGLQQVAKGPELSAWSRRSGPFVLPGDVQHWMDKLRGFPESEIGPRVSLSDTLDSDRRMPGSSAEEVAVNLRRLISSRIDQSLRRDNHRFDDDELIWTRVRELLDDRTVLLTWFLPGFSGVAAVLIAVTRQGHELYVFRCSEEGAGCDPIGDQVDAIRTEVCRDPLFDEVTPEGRRLLDGKMPVGIPELWARWRELGKDRVLFWPHGPLHHLPLPLCRVGNRLIADDFTVTVIAGLESLTSVGGPTRPPATAVLASAEGGVAYGLPHEPTLETHAVEVATAVGTSAVVNATRARLLVELSTVDVLHLAVHGSLDHEAPWLHCLYLSPDTDDDGRVFAYDFLETDLRGVRLVTLAACESALSRFDRSDNLRGIPAALVTAGAQAVVGCAWPVRPEPATWFYEHLHRDIAHGVEPVTAFRAAQVATRGRYPHYRDWGAFTYLHGRRQGATP